MQTEDIILWADKAIEVRETSYQKPDGITFFIGTYRKTPYDCIEETKPKEAKDYDVSIALWMVEYSNDVTEWKKQIKNKQSFKDRISFFIDERVKLASSDVSRTCYLIVKNFIDLH